MHAGIILTVAAMTLMVLALGCADKSASGPERTAAAATDKGQADFIHVVFFDLKPGTPAEEIDGLIDDAYRLLAKVPTVRKIDSGRRDDRMARDVNDMAFTVGLVVYFDDKAGHDVYATHPQHLEYIARHKEHWAKVRVFDYCTPARAR